ncbi:winged helix-turn-helix transcriptional regulator [Nocardia sp. CA-120079]|uniref:winged helix-turn-helix transcriptional regulator n=1 Tax=Nocardia sp. CA-120079 TaxID=3239974 RepID=UPI003D952707
MGGTDSEGGHWQPVHPDLATISTRLHALSADLEVRPGAEPSILATIAGPAGTPTSADSQGRLTRDTARVLVLTSLSEGPLRFHQLRARIQGVSDKMLTQTLRTFADDGLVERTVLPTAPPSVMYELTDLGAEAARELEPFLRWVRATASASVTAAAS